MAAPPVDSRALLPPPRVHAVNHLRVEIPTGGQTAVAAFYGDLLGLKRLSDIEETGGRTLAFGGDRLAIYFVPCECPRISPRRRRLTLTVDSLGEVHERLVEKKRRVWTLSGLSLSERSLLTVDPFDQIVELRQSQRL